MSSPTLKPPVFNRSSASSSPTLSRSSNVTPLQTPRLWQSGNTTAPPSRLLMPTVRSHSSVATTVNSSATNVSAPATAPTQAPRSPRLKPTTTKLIRARSSSQTHSNHSHSNSQSQLDIATPAAAAPVWTSADTGLEWLGQPFKFDVVQEQLEIEGYQMYAVEKWIVDRHRPVTVLTVYTGDPSHKITVTALGPSSALSHADAQAEWEKALHYLRRDGARPRETLYGVLMATSLAHFRSDFTIVHIPHGDFLAVQEQLYTNINLLRMGCSGRSALTLEEPSDTTKDRFISMYHLPETAATSPNITSSPTDTFPSPTSTPVGSPTKSKSKDKYQPYPYPTKAKPHSLHQAHESLSLTDGTVSGFESTVSKAGNAAKRTSPGIPPSIAMSSSGSGGGKGKTKDRVLFNTTVLELVKLVQAGLAIFGMYGVKTGVGGEADAGNSVVLDGLLCDVTIEGIQKWVGEIGEPCVGVEPMERVADPMVVSAILSLVLSIRNKLAALGYGHVVPKDPFLYPRAFSIGLAAYIQSTLASGSIPNQHQYTFQSSHFPVHPPAFSHHHMQSIPNVSAPIHMANSANKAVLTRALVEAISEAYDGKAKPNDGRKVRRALKNKLDDFTSVVGGGGDKDRDGSDGEGRGRMGAGGGTVSGGEGGGGGVGIGGSGGQILSGIGSLARLGLSGGAGGASGGAAGVLEGTMDLAAFVRVVVGKDKEKKEKDKKGRGKEKGREKDAGEDGAGHVHVHVYGYGYGGKEKEKDGGVGGVGGSVRGLWSGRVVGVVRLRELEMEREKMGPGFGAVVGRREKEKEKAATKGEAEKERDAAKERDKENKWRERWALGVASDGDVEDRERDKEKGEKEGRSTEEESDLLGGGFGGMGMGPWSGRVQKKIESWTSRNRFDGKRKKGTPSVDSSAGQEDVGAGRFGAGAPTSEPSRSAVVQPQSPTLPPIVFVGDRYALEEEELLSSGQVSPISDHPTPNPFNMLYNGPSNESSALNLNTDYERKVTAFNQKRPWGNRIHQSRVSSWSDPVSAREILDGELGEEEEGSTEEGSGVSERRESRGRRKRSQLGGASILGEHGEGEIVDEPEEYERVDEPRRRGLEYGARRRRSFHDLSAYREMRVLTPERMRIDVELCGQLLVMSRREEHLRNVLACLHGLTASLSSTSAILREDYQSHMPFFSRLEASTKVIADIDTERAKADMTMQETNTLLYESDQFLMRDLWHMASPPRQKVFTLREKVFGTGGRRLPPGVHGAHGQFNRLQWTLDGRERLVDHMGRTESEVEEESALDPEGEFVLPGEEDEEDVVEHPGIKPMWLLRFFTSWGARWGAAPKQEEGKGKEKEGGMPSSTRTSVGPDDRSPISLTLAASP